MKKLWQKMISLTLAAGLTMAAAGCGAPAKEAASSSSGSGKPAQEVLIGQSSWIGFAPLYIAEEKGFFKKHGADVKIQSIESKADSKSALAAGRIQGVSTTADTHVVNAAAGIDIAQVLALDTSSGGDGIIAK